MIIHQRWHFLNKKLSTFQKYIFASIKQSAKQQCVNMFSVLFWSPTLFHVEPKISAKFELKQPIKLVLITFSSTKPYLFCELNHSLSAYRNTFKCSWPGAQLKSIYLRLQSVFHQVIKMIISTKKEGGQRFREERECNHGCTYVCGSAPLSACVRAYTVLTDFRS